MRLSIAQLNTLPLPAALEALAGLYEHSPWIAQAALAQRPFGSVAQLKRACVEVLRAAGPAAQLALIRAHPELAGKAMVAKTLTAESSGEQSRAGLADCTPEEFAQIQTLNSDYNARFGFPFVLAVRGPRGTGLTRQQIIATFARRLNGQHDFERAECLRQIHRIAEVRLHDILVDAPELGHALWDWHEALATHSDAEATLNGQLTVTYLTDAHRACAAQILSLMQTCGFDSAHIDAVGNIVGRYENDSYRRNIHDPSGLFLLENRGKALLTGSHYDTVRNAGKYDGRLGIFVPVMCVRELARQGRRLPIALEVVAFAEEEGQRFKATFLGSGALLGQFNPAWLGQLDAHGVSLLQAIRHAGDTPGAADTRSDTRSAGDGDGDGDGNAQRVLADINALRRNAADYVGFVEVHIEQGPVLNALDLPLGIVTSINGSVRLACEVIGTASHAGTTPMGQRGDAACAVAELILFAEARAQRDADSVATVGQLLVPQGSVNVVPGRCTFTLDMRAPNDPQRDALVADVCTELAQICQRRGLRFTLQESLRAAAAPSDGALQARWESAVAALGLPVYRMPSGAGHDAMKLHEMMPQAMLFVRGENAGISHNPLESTTSDDMQLALQAFMNLLDGFAAPVGS